MRKLKSFYKPFVFFFLISFLIFNWSDISPLFYYFNFRVIKTGIFPLFDWLGPQGIEISYPEQENIIKIPKLKIKAPILSAGKENKQSFQNLLEKGVLHYPTSALPGQKGVTVILGHSAPPGWPKINYDWVFSNLKELEKGDRIYIYFNHRRFTYQIEDKFFLERGEEVPQLNGLTNSKSELVLLSCWPPGKSQKRIAIKAILIN